MNHPVRMAPIIPESAACGKPMKLSKCQPVLNHPRKGHRYCATFEAADCDGCSFCISCGTLPLKRKPKRVLRFLQQDVEVALRRQRTADVRASRQNLRSAVEATVRSIKHPFGSGIAQLLAPHKSPDTLSSTISGSRNLGFFRRVINQTLKG